MKNYFLKKWLNKISFLKKKIKDLSQIFSFGELVSVNGLVLEIRGLKLPIGSICLVECKIENKNIVFQEYEVIGFNQKAIYVMELEKTNFFPIQGAIVIAQNYECYQTRKVPLGIELLGRVVNSYGEPIDGKKNFTSSSMGSFLSKTINPLDRSPIVDVLDTGVKTINSLFTIGRGQRMGLFSSSGLGKSMLLGMIAKYSKADIIVIGLIGERAREINEFINLILKKKGLSKSVVVAAPADSSPLFRVKGAMYASRIAEYFSNQNHHVLLIIDSLTRYAMACREISLAIGEIPIVRGYPASIFSQLPSLIEKSGNGKNSSSSVTAFYTVLTDPDQLNDPIAEIAKSVLDGHIVLSRFLAESGRYPAIDIKKSVSRIMLKLVSQVHYEKACQFKSLFSHYWMNKDLINIGAYVKGRDLFLDQAVKLFPKLEKFLQQKEGEKYTFAQSNKLLYSLF